MLTPISKATYYLFNGNISLIEFAGMKFVVERILWLDSWQIKSCPGASYNIGFISVKSGPSLNSIPTCLRG